MRYVYGISSVEEKRRKTTSFTLVPLNQSCSNSGCEKVVGWGKLTETGVNFIFHL